MAIRPLPCCTDPGSSPSWNPCTEHRKSMTWQQKGSEPQEIELSAEQVEENKDSRTNLCSFDQAANLRPEGASTRDDGGPQENLLKDLIVSLQPGVPCQSNNDGKADRVGFRSPFLFSYHHVPHRHCPPYPKSAAPGWNPPYRKLSRGDRCLVQIAAADASRQLGSATR